MEIIIIFLFLALVTASMIASYVPYNMHIPAKKAGFGKFSLRYLILKLQKVPVKFLFEENEKLSDKNIHIDFYDLKEAYLQTPDKFQNIIKVLLQASDSNIKISLEEIEIYNIKENNAERFFSVLKNASPEYLKDHREQILQLVNSRFDIPTFLKLVEKTNEFEFNFFGGNTNPEDLPVIELLAENLQQFKNHDIKFRFRDNDDSSWSEKLTFSENLLYLKKNKIEISEDVLSEMYQLKMNTGDYIKSIEKLKEHKDIDFDKEKVKTYFKNGGNFLKVLDAYEFAELNKTEISFEDFIKAESDHSTDFDEAVQNAVIPYSVEIDEITPVLLKDGIQIKPKIHISVKKRITAFDTRSSIRQLTAKFDELLHKYLLTFDGYAAVTQNLNSVSNMLLQEVLSDKKASYNTDFDILNIMVSDMDIKTDKFAEIKRIEAEERSNDEKLKLIESKRKINEDMSKALNEGKISFKDYQKEKYIFNPDDENDLPYHD